MLPIERISGKNGNKILAAGTHTVQLTGFVSKADATAITGMKVNGVALANMDAYWPAGTTFDKGELFLFPIDLVITEVTVAAAGAINAILRS